MPRFSRLAAQAVCVAALIGTAAAGADQPPITLTQAIERAAAQHPALAAAEAALRAQQGRISEAALRAQTSAEVLVEDAAGTGDREGFSAAQTTLSIAHVFELGGKRDGRIAVARAEVALLATEQQGRRLDLATEVARRFVETLLAQAQAEVATDAVRGAERTLEAVDKRVRNAQAPAAEVARAQVGLEEAKLDLEHAEHQLKAARQFLAAAMGSREVTFGRCAGSLLDLAETLPLQELEQQVESSPEFLRLTDQARLRDAQVRLAELRRRPDLRTQVGVRHYADNDDVALMAGISVPIGSRRRAAGGIEVARAERAQVDSERQVALLAARAQLFDHYQELEHARLETQVLRGTIVPRLADALEKSEYAYQRGRYSYLEWTQVQRELLGARTRLNEAAARFHALRNEIERLAGRSVALPGESP